MKAFAITILVLATMVWPFWTVPLSNLYKKFSAKFPYDKKARPKVDIILPAIKLPKSREEWAQGKMKGKW